MASRIKVMIVDDSAVVRQTLSQILASDGQLEVVGAHSNPIFAMKAMELLWPDVLVLDVEMPQMDGITFLRSIMKSKPLPVIICSSLTTQGASTTLEAMSAGAIEVISKPTSGLKDYLQQMAPAMIAAVKTAAQVKMASVVHVSKTLNRPVKHLTTVAHDLQEQRQSTAMSATTDQLIALGTSTGGTQALEYLLPRLPITAPGMLVVQHMPAAFTKAFAERLNTLSTVLIKEAEHNERILSGHVYIANGGLHLEIRRQGAFYYTVLRDGPLVSRHKPSVNVLFNSVAKYAGKNAMGILLTGMGDDGARGLLQLRESGAATIAQDEASSVVFGMPKEAIKIGAASEVLSLSQILDVIQKAVISG
ncbi:chemotaxis response regulator protein-glutamate methylesterase [Alkalimonas sp. MEB108]|uniref:Protein-glutamate methylesterase/protein-glutamine glutaminase n=1 Tax=Alkalimonas cellulosilytica TaxID=3058395 RepID=A0ABU7J7N9_9GAMM|nr:chemotaxis response regulator protein-glutamate methylesterase [Alkalimonas sp. MEB108]MEE2002298.1 chemotaxis response regulator protein-glutamate methylesterase [Alkalimonas sp. MEB108]